VSSEWATKGGCSHQISASYRIKESESILSPEYFTSFFQIIYQNGTQSSYADGFGTQDDIVEEAIDSFLKISSSGVLTDLGQQSPENLFAQLPVLVQFMQEHNTVSQRRFATCCQFD
jgi:hypothetical protein